MNIMESLNEALRAVITFVPKFLAFLVILLIGWLIAKGLRKLVGIALERLNFNRAVERGGIKRRSNGPSTTQRGWSARSCTTACC